VDRHLAEAERAWGQEELRMKQDGPKIFDNWHWHAAHCQGKPSCVFPWRPDSPPPPREFQVVKRPPPPGPRRA
jgi:hypothetical protein